MEKEKRIEAIWKALKKYGIHSEEELKVAMQNMKPLNIGCMVSPPKGVKQHEGKSERMART